MNGERNLQLIREIEANREFLLLLYGQNPDLLARTEPRIRQLFEPLPGVEKENAQRVHHAAATNNTAAMKA